MIYPLPANNLYDNAPIPLQIPDNWEVHICQYAGVDTPALTQEQIAAIIATPEGCTPIREAARGKKDAIIIIDDVTRPTPCGPIAKAVIAELEQAGVPRDKIRFLAAVGTHRAMSREDFSLKLGEDLVQEFRCYSHNPFHNNVVVGTSTTGVELELNTEAATADFKIAIGNAVPHGAVGIAGGPKTILPGIASLKSIMALHTAGRSGRWDLSVPGRDLACQAARMLGLDIKIDAVLNGKGEICKLYAGEVGLLAEAHEQELKEFYRTPYVEGADLLIANNYFKPSEPYLSISWNGLPFTVKQGGSLVVAANSRQGAAAHYLLGSWGDNDVNGPMFGSIQVYDWLEHYYAFSVWQDKGMGASYHLYGDRLKWVDKWEQIMADMGTEPKKLVIYPYATVGYYDVDGNIPDPSLQ